MARLSHPGIVEIYDYAGDAAAESYLVTEFVRGRTLRAYAHEVGFGFPEVRRAGGRWRWPTRSSTPTRPASSTGT